MPDRELKIIKHLIFFQYVKVIAKNAFEENAKQISNGFIKTTFRELINDVKKCSDILREDKQFIKTEKECVYCGNKENLRWENIVSKSLYINERCLYCEKIQGIHNQIWACISCNSKKGTKGLYTFIKEIHPEVKKYSTSSSSYWKRNI